MNKTSWIYLSRKAAQREFEFLRFMYCKGMPVPKPIDSNRHVVVMELIDGRILNHYTLESFEPEKRDRQIEALYKNLMDLIFRFANETRVIHGDFNEFNILIKRNEKLDELEPVIIDLPQMIGVDHELAPEQFERDVNCIVEFFNKRFHYESEYVPQWADIDDSPKDESNMDKFLLDALKSIDDDDDVDARYVERPTTTIQKRTAQSRGPERESTGQNLANIDYKDQDSETDNSDTVNEDAIVDDIDECMSQFTTMTVDPLDARRRLRSEIIKKENNKKKRDAAKPKNIKGEANPVRRRKKVNEYVVCEDSAAYKDIY